MLIGVLRRVSVLSTRLPIGGALSIVADEIEAGVQAFNKGETVPLTHAAMLGGTFMGDKREDKKVGITPAENLMKAWGITDDRY